MILFQGWGKGSGKPARGIKWNPPIWGRGGNAENSVSLPACYTFRFVPPPLSTPLLHFWPLRTAAGDGGRGFDEDIMLTDMKMAGFLQSLVNPSKPCYSSEDIPRIDMQKLQQSLSFPKTREEEGNDERPSNGVLGWEGEML